MSESRAYRDSIVRVVTIRDQVAALERDNAPINDVPAVR